jgi:hypothetical protein
MKKTPLIILAIVIIILGAGFYESQKNKIIPKNNTTDVPSKNQEQKPAQEQPAKTEGNNPAPQTENKITTFEQCVAAGKEVTGQKPKRQCKVSNDLSYIEIEICKALTGESMNIYDAQRAFDASQCGLEGSAKDNHFCNETTGTWWIDIQAYRKGCNPACVIDVKTKKAEVNWRCTGLIPPQ